MRSAPVRWTLALLAAGLVASSVPPAGADARNPLPRFLEALDVGPAAEFRFAVVHPILVPPPPKDAPAAPARPDLLAQTPADAVGMPSSARPDHAAVRVANLGPRAAWALPGDVLRLDDGDHVVTADRAVPAAGAADVPTTRLAGPPPAGTPHDEPRRLGSVPGPALLWVVLASPRDFVTTGLGDELAREAGLDTPRKSPAELARGKAIARRVGEYRTQLSALVRPPAAGRREIAGYAVLLDGGLAGVEVFSDPRRFAAVWPERVEGIATEAALLEVENGAFDAALPAPADPDRFTAALKEWVLAIYGLDPVPEKAEGLGSVLGLAKDDDAGRAVVGADGTVQHLLRVRDPSRRRAAPTGEGEEPLDPGVIARKARPTEFEKRWLERRRVPPPTPRKE